MNFLTVLSRANCFKLDASSLTRFHSPRQRARLILLSRSLWRSIAILSLLGRKFFVPHGNVVFRLNAKLSKCGCRSLLFSQVLIYQYIVITYLHGVQHNSENYTVIGIKILNFERLRSRKKLSRTGKEYFYNSQQISHATRLS